MRRKTSEIINKYLQIVYNSFAARHRTMKYKALRCTLINVYPSIVHYYEA